MSAPSADAQARLDALAREVEADPDERLEQAQRHLYARLPPPDALREGETYDVDLTEPLLVHARDGQPVTWARPQVVGTWSDGTFLWGWRNPSLAATGWGALREALSKDPELAPILELDAFPIDAAKAARIALALAARAGFATVYPATKGSTLIHLAVRPTLSPPGATEDDAGAPELRSAWCSGCGAARHEVRVLLAGLSGSICDGCTRDLVDVLAESSVRDEDPEAEPVHEAMPPCILTGRKTPRIFLAYAAVSAGAIARLEEVLREQGLL